MNPLELSKKTVLILGAGKTGVSAAKFLIGKTKKILLSDTRNLNSIDESNISSLKQNGIESEFGHNSDDFLNKADLIIVSPGISPFTEVIQKATAKNIPIISDIELASYYTKKPLICITGTNGKTTTTLLTAHLLNQGNINALSCGNIGVPIFDAIQSKEHFQYLVVEVSSYQIFYSPTLSPYIAICLNITPDHLDWHRSLEHYIGSKKKLFENQNTNSWSILNAADSTVVNFPIQGNAIYFTHEKIDTSKYKYIAYFDNEHLVIKFQDKSEALIHKNKLHIFGMHNIDNALASISVTKIIGLETEKIQSGLQSFEGVEHRLELTNTTNKKEYYNDSKATNPESTIKAIEALKTKSKHKKISLIMGGRDKKTNIKDLVTTIKENIDHVILLGEAKDRFNDELLKNQYSKKIKIVNSLEEAVKETLSSNTDIVLFSPACSSFDMFKNYEERGKIFKEVISKLKTV